MQAKLAAGTAIKLWWQDKAPVGQENIISRRFAGTLALSRVARDPSRALATPSRSSNTRGSAAPTSAARQPSPTRYAAAPERRWARTS